VCVVYNITTMGSVKTYHMSFKGLWKKWFKSKLCKQCQVKMKLDKVEVPQGVGWNVWVNGLNVDFNYGDKFDVYYVYKCESCDLIVRLDDL